MARRPIIGIKIRFWDDLSGRIEVVRGGHVDKDTSEYPVYRLEPMRPIPRRLQRAQAMQRALMWRAINGKWN